MSSRLQHFPVPLFASVMGLGGYALATRMTGLTLFSHAMVALVSLWALFVFGMYLAKAVKFFPAVKQEFNHPVRHAFFPAISVALLILAEVYAPYSLVLSQILWTVGTVVQLWFTVHILNKWFFAEGFNPAMINPAWFIAVAGNVLVPIAGVRFAPVEVLWFFLSVGLLLWLVFQTILTYRMVFHTPLPKPLMPTLWIMLVPPAAGFLAYVKVVQGVDLFALFLFNIAVFFALMLVYRVRVFLSVPFGLPWWAYTFPLSALTMATFSMGKLTHNPMLQGVLNGKAWGLFVITTIVVAIVLYKTMRAMMAGKICVPEAPALTVVK